MKKHSYFHGLLITCLLTTAVYTPTAHSNGTSNAIAISAGACLIGGGCYAVWHYFTREQRAYCHALVTYHNAIETYTNANQSSYTELDKQIELAQNGAVNLVDMLKPFINKGRNAIFQTKNGLEKATNELQAIISNPKFAATKDIHMLLEKMPTLINSIINLLEKRSYTCNFFQQHEAYFTIEEDIHLWTTNLIEEVNIELQEGHAIVHPLNVKHYYSNASYPNIQLYNDLKSKIQMLDNYKLNGKLYRYALADETTRSAWETLELQLRTILDAVSNCVAYVNECREQEQALARARIYELEQELIAAKQNMAYASQKQQMLELQKMINKNNIAGQNSL